MNSTTSTTQSNPFLMGNFAPVAQEVTSEHLPVIGSIPEALNGCFLRNGPNPQFPPIGQYHWFDGDGMVHNIQLHQGQAIYRNRYVRTAGFLKEKEAQAPLWTGLMEPPRPGHEPSVKNVANTAIVWHSGRCFAVWEGGEPHVLTLPELETVGACDFDHQLKSAFTAHPKIDAQSGELFFFGYSLTPPYLQYSIVSPEGKLTKTIPVQLPEGVMMHDFAITEQYAVFLDLPMVFRPERMAQGEPMLAFEKERPSRFGIMPRSGDGEVQWFEAPSCYAFHVLNAYEDGDEVVLMACRLQEFSMTGLGDPALMVPYLYQWRFNLRSHKVTETKLSEIPCEFPQINPQYTGLKNRYGYVGKSAPTPMPLFDGVIKFDFGEDGTQAQISMHQLPPNTYCGEAVFASRSGATAEDEGWLLTIAHNEETQQSELLILQAQDMAAPAIARVQLPQRVPYGFHAAWVDETAIASHSS